MVYLRLWVILADKMVHPEDEDGSTCNSDKCPQSLVFSACWMAVQLSSSHLLLPQLQVENPAYERIHYNHYNR